MTNFDKSDNYSSRCKLFYDPFNLFFKRQTNSQMMFSGELILDTELYTIGKEAIQLLDIKERDDFESALSAFWEWCDLFKETLSERTDISIWYLDVNGINNKVPITEVESDVLISVAWEFFEKIKLDKNVDLKDFDSNSVFFQLSLTQVFFSIQDCLFAMGNQDVYSGISCAITATRMLQNAQVINLKQDNLISLRRELSFKAAMARLSKEPKQNAMKQIDKAYLNKWESGYRFPQGTLMKFYEQMANQEFEIEGQKIKLELISIKNRIERLRKELGHSETKKQSS